MLPVILAISAAAIVAAIIYLGRERVGLPGLGLAALRTVAFAALLLALFNPSSTSRTAGGAPTVLLDASLSMQAVGGKWQAALDTAQSLSSGGTLFSFGTGVQPFDTSRAPQAGESRLNEALQVASGRSGPVFVVTDGEIEDAHGIQPSLAGGASMVIIPRDTLPSAAILDVALNDVVAQGDTTDAIVTIGTWGLLGTTSASLQVLIGERLIGQENVSLPGSPGTGRRTIAIPSTSLAVGTNALRFRLEVPADSEPRDNERIRVLTVTTEPGVVLLVDPADPEGRFLARELGEIVRTGMRSFAHIGDSRWVDMRTLGAVQAGEAQRAARGAALVISRGSDPWEGGGPSWHWPAGTSGETQFFQGDWYVTGEVPASPVAGRLASIPWDSLPPLTGIVPLVPGTDQWVGMNGRLGRRGADRPLLVGEDSAGTRRLTTAGAGLWRWALRGGSSLDAYRAVIASGVDWLLDSDDAPTAARISASTHVSRGRSVTFRRVDSEVADSLDISVSGSDSTTRLTVVFDAANEARIHLEPGVYRWSVPSVPGAGGTVAVESYSEEFHPRAVAFESRNVAGGFSLLVRYARERWWLFAIAMLALIGEWAWRQRIGLP